MGYNNQSPTTEHPRFYDDGRIEQRRERRLDAIAIDLNKMPEKVSECLDDLYPGWFQAVQDHYETKGE
jgi:hypothetical protein